MARNNHSLSTSIDSLHGSGRAPLEGEHFRTLGEHSHHALDETLPAGIGDRRPNDHWFKMTDKSAPTNMQADEILHNGVYLSDDKSALTGTMEMAYVYPSKHQPPVEALQELNKLFPDLHNDRTNRVLLDDGDIFDHMRDAYSHRNDSMMDKLAWIQKQESNHKHWDYKDYYADPKEQDTESRVSKCEKANYVPFWVENYGNFHYGAIVCSADLSIEAALLAAGVAQQGGAGGYRINSPEGAGIAALSLLKALALPNNGDADINDQFQIWLGYEWASKHAAEIGVEK